MKALTVDEVMALRPSPYWTRERVERLYGSRCDMMSAAGFLSSDPAELPWDACLWVLRYGRLISDRVWQLWAIDCASRALPVFERKFPRDKRPRNAIAAAAGVASGELPVDAAAHAAARAADDAVRDADDAATTHAAYAARAATRAAYAAHDAVRDAAHAADDAARSLRAADAEQIWQREHLLSLVREFGDLEG